jgi:hypothetical protein
MSTGTSSTSTSSNFSSQYNPAQYGLLGQSNSGFYQGLGSIPLGGYGAATTSDGDFSSIFSALNSGGTFGPGLNSNTGPAGANPQALAMVTEGATEATAALLNRLAPLDTSVESQYKGTVFGGLSGGLSIFDMIGTVANSVTGLIPLSGSISRYLVAAGPAFGALSGVMGLFQGIRALKGAEPVKLQSSAEDMESYSSDDDRSA